MTRQSERTRNSPIQQSGEDDKLTVRKIDLDTELCRLADAESQVLSLDGRKKSNRRFLSNLISLYTLQGLNDAVQLAVLPYLVRVLGIERYGLLAFA